MFMRLKVGKIFFISLSLICFSSVYPQASEKEEIIKKADLAGLWYPKDKTKLSLQIENYLDKSKPLPVKERIIGVISPHAGLIYSGEVAASGFKLLETRKINTVIIVGFSHRKYFEGISVYNRGEFETPLGNLKIDSLLADNIISQSSKFKFLPFAFNQENSVEMLLIFIKKVLPQAKIVPLAFGDRDYQNCKLLSRILAKIIKSRNDVVVIFSTDLSHYHPYEEAKRIDMRTIKLIKELKPQQIYETIMEGEQLCCGFMPVVTALLMAEEFKEAKVHILKYGNSGDTAGDKRKVVGYLSAVITVGSQELKEKNKLPINYLKESKEEEMGLSREDKKTLLEIARKVLENYLSSGKIPEFKVDSRPLLEIRGAFVTLKRDGQLRGCIGNIVGKEPLYLTVRDMAIQAATQDPRFSPVKYKELKDIEIEISVLSPLKRVSSAQEIELGKHGVVVKKGFRQGVFLPQVAEETGWTKEEFLSYLCLHKAGLPAQAWRDPAVELYVFTADVFSEQDFSH